MAAIDDDIPEVQSLPTRDFNPNTNWQGSWPRKCTRLCCYAKDCADIGCASCLQSIVRPLPPGQRYICLECELSVSSDRECASSPNVQTDEHSSVDFCDACFASITAAHIGAKDGKAHTKWLRISSEGQHTVVERAVAVGVSVREVRVQDLTAHPLEALPNDCPVCTCEFEAEDPRCSPPGCSDPEHGWHADCVLQFLRTTNKHVYFTAEGGGGALPPKTYFCNACREVAFREGEMAAILKELDGVLSAFSASAAGNGGNDARAAAEAALAGAPSLAGRDLVASIEEPPAAGAEVWAAAWAVGELKRVHAVRGRVNAHLHEALDTRMAQLKSAGL